MSAHDSGDTTMSFMGLTMDCEPTYDWSLPQTVQGPLYEREGWSSGAYGVGHMWVLTCTKHDRSSGSLVIHRHPVYDGIAFPGRASMQAFKLKHDLTKVYVPRKA